MVKLLPAWMQFLSTPSARRATCTRFYFGSGQCISIHALREEGDRQLPRRRHQHHPISIHALREEGDPRFPTCTLQRANFYPRPP